MKLFDLCAGWSVHADSQQWMLSRKRGKSWHAVAFIGCFKRVLLRVIAEYKITPTKAGQAALDRLPASFLEWKARQS